MCENAYLSIKNPKASRALKRALDPCRRMLALLARLRFAMSATFGLRSWGPPLDQILDPHLITPQHDIYCSFCDYVMFFMHGVHPHDGHLCMVSDQFVICRSMEIGQLFPDVMVVYSLVFVSFLLSSIEYDQVCKSNQNKI